MVGISIVMAGILAATVTAQPSPFVAVSFALSALLLAASLTLAGRVVIALERARRRVRPPQPPLSDSLPLLSKLSRQSKA